MAYFVTSDSAKIYFEDRGQGKTILFCHGLNSSHLELKNFIDNFKDEYRCVYYDHRGHCASEKISMKILSRNRRNLFRRGIDNTKCI